MDKLTQTTFATLDTTRTYFIASFVSFLFFSLQTISLLALDATTTYFQAQLIIAVSLFGLLLGTLWAAYVQKSDCSTWVKYVLYTAWLLPLLSLGLILISFSYPLLATLGFVFVFAPLGFVISVLYRFVSAWKLYASELLGAMFGLGYFILAIPYMRSENALIALVAIAAISTSVLLVKHTAMPLRVLLVAVLLASGAGLFSNIHSHHLNFALHTLCTGERVNTYANNKIACLDELGTPYELEVSLGSLQSRIDVYRTSTDGFFFTAYSGTRNDVMQPFSAEHYTQDARIPAGLIADPKTLVIGAGAEGVAKVAKAIGATDITVVENNPAVLHIWNENLPYAEFAQYPLRDTRVVLDDGRLFAQKAKAEYDIITMMNTRRALDIAQFGFPNFLHTQEAFSTYYEALTATGFLAIEEVSYQNQGDEAIARVVATISTMLEHKGVEDPNSHLLVYQWVGAEKDLPIPKDPALVYTQILVKKTPWSKEDLAAFRTWSTHSQQTEDFTKPANMTFYRSLWLPDTGFNRNVATSSALAQPFTGEMAQIKVLTDKAPFITTMNATDKLMLYIFFGVSGVLLMIFLIWYRRYSAAATGNWLGYFFLIGIGYMVIEVFLLLWLQLYLGSLFITLVVVIGGLFSSSALASLYYQQNRFSVKTLALRGLLAVILLGMVLYIPWAIDDFRIRVLFAVAAVVGIGFLLAPFFPFAMQLAEQRLNNRAPILFGVNAIALAVAVPAAILLVSYTSFQILIVAGILAYSAALVFLFKSNAVS